MKKWLVFIPFIAFPAFTDAQNAGKTTFEIKILPSNSVIESKDKILVINTESDTIHIDKLKFYLSNLSIVTDKKKNVNFPEKAYLVDVFANENFALEINLDKKMNIKQLHFTLGIDSLLNSSGVSGGALDPTKGMYWTWNSGYINMMMEGTSRICPTRNNQFQLHLGGYLSPNQSWQNITLDIANQGNSIIYFDVKKFFDSFGLEKSYKIMSPGSAGQAAIKLASNCFSIQSK